MKTMLAVMIKILLFPMALMLRIISGVALAVIKVSSMIAGPLFILFGILAVFCLLRQEWMNLTILLGIGGGVWALYFAAGYLCGAAEAASDRMLI